MNFDRTNTYKGTCFLCGAGVKAQRGRLLRADEVEGVPVPEGKPWLTLCNSKLCVGRVLGSDVVASSERCEIEADGTIHVPNPATVYPFLRAIGSKVEGGWVASPHRRDRDHVLRVANKMGLTIAPEFARYKDPRIVREAVARARAVPTIRDYQIEGVRRLAYVGIDDAQGCGDEARFNPKDKLRGFVEADDQGLGKSIMTLLALHDDEALVVICNASAKSVWPIEAKKWRPDRFDEYTIVKGERGFRWPKNPREMVVCNYDVLPFSPAQVKNKHEHETAKLHGHRAQLNSKTKWRRKDIRGLYQQRTKHTRKLRRLTATWAKRSVTTAQRHQLFVAMVPLAELHAKIKRVQQTLERNKLRKKLAPPPCPVFVVGDELHYVENSKALRTKSWRYLTRFARRVVGLTGTPVESAPMKLFGLLTSACANPFSWELFKKQFNAFDQEWGIDFERHPPAPGSTALGAVKVESGTTELIQRVLLRRTKEQVLPELPPKIYSEIPVEIPKRLRKQLDELAAEHMDKITLNGDELTPFPALSKTLKLLSITCIDTLMAIVQSHEMQGIPLVVFSPNKPPIEKLGTRKGWLTSLKDKNTLQERFQAGEGFGVAGTASIAESLTLTRANTVVQVLPFLSRKKNKQAVDRLHRIGQRDVVNVISLVPDHVLVRHIYALLAAKDQFVDDVLTGEAGSVPGVRESQLVDEDESTWRARVEATQRSRGTTAVQPILPSMVSVSAEVSEARAKARAHRLGLELPQDVDATHVAAALQDALNRDILSPSAASVGAWLLPGVLAGLPCSTATAVLLTCKSSCG